MRVWGISDLHLSFSTNKPMDIFGHNWKNHAEQMQLAWDSMVAPEDVVLCPGDLSWAMRLEEAKPDLEWIGARPGTKILGRGNHDYWWSGINKLRATLPSSCIALQNDAVDLGKVVVAGSRSWAMPGAIDFTEQDQKIYERELVRLKMSLDEATAIRGDKTLIASIHYPPFTANGSETKVTKLLEEYEVNICVFGHLHGAKAHRTAVQGYVNGITYHLLACDYLQFKPKLILE